MKRLMKRLMRNVLAPTAANASLEANRPTTATSMVINNCSRILLSANGIAYLNILPNKGP